MSINDHKKTRRSLMMAILTTLLISGTATTAALSYQTGSVYGQGQATLRVIKNLICELPTVCPIVPSNFRIQVTGNNPIPASFDGSSQGTVVTLAPGDYSVSESTPPPAPPGLTLRTARSPDCTGNINEGESRTCIMTNAYLSPNADADGDNLRNTWEINGIDVNNDGRIDFVLPQADPLHKNLYVEVDYMQFHRPIGGDSVFGSAIQDVKRAFTNAPVSNPDGRDGVNLFVLLNEQIPHANTTSENNLDTTIKNMWFGTAAERADANAMNLLAGKRLAFHYGLFAHQQPAPFQTSSGVGNLPGMNFLVTFGAPGWAPDPVSKHPIGTRTQQAFTFMHELGHNMNLLHGGNDNVQCKNNYLSSMNYLFSLGQYVANNSLDFSHSALPTLNESNLNEVNGIGQSTPPGLATIYNGPGAPFQGPRNTTAGVGLDFNFNGRIDFQPVISDINGGLACRTSSPSQIMNGFNDWNALIYSTAAQSLLTPLQVEPSQVEEEPDMPTVEEVREARLVLLTGIDNAILRLGGSIDLSPIAELLQTDQLEAAIAELIDLKAQVIAQFGEEAANIEVVGQIQNLIGVLEKQINPLTPPSPPSPPPASACIGTGNRDSRIIGTPGPDTIIGTDGHNIISGLGGDDSINGCGNVDSISGNAGNDGIAGGPARDRLHGDEGDDIVQGDAGDDVIFGDAGVNTLTGGPGRDIFFCSPEGETTITDFVPGVDRFRGPCMIADGTSSASEEAGASASDTSASDTSASDTSASDTSASDTSASDTRNGLNAQDRSGSDVSADIERDRTYKALEKRLERD